MKLPYHIFGTERSYADVINTARGATATGRKACINFAKKASESDRFGSAWFPRKICSNYDTRNPEKFVEKKVRTERMRKNPLNFMAHELNKIS